MNEEEGSGARTSKYEKLAAPSKFVSPSNLLASLFVPLPRMSAAGVELVRRYHPG